MLDRTFLKSGRFCLGLCLLLTIVTAPVAYRIGPWFNAGATPLQLRLNAPATASIEVSWGPTEQEKAPLVPFTDPGKGTTDLWLGELPPRPEYRLTFIFHEAVRSELRELTLPSGRSRTPTASFAFPRDAHLLTVDGAAIDRKGDALRLDAQPNGRLTLLPVIEQCRQPRWKQAGAAWLLMLVLLLPATVALHSLIRDVRVPGALALSRPRPGLLWGAVIASALVQVLMVISSPVLFAQGDSTSYMLKAASLVEQGHYDTGGFEYELNRPPGYPLFLAGAIKLFGYYMTNMAALQAIMFSLSVAALAFSVRRWVPDSLLAVGILLAGLSPAQIWFARILITESCFASASLISLACLFRHVVTSGRRSVAWFLLFTLAATWATFIRPNGIVLFAACVPLYVPGAVRAFQDGGLWKSRLQRLARFSRLYLAGAGLAGILVLSWSIRNHDSRGFFCFTDMGGISKLMGVIESGLFDPACLISRNLHTDYVTGRYTSNYWYSGWRIRNARFLERTDGGRRMDGKLLRKLDRDLSRIADDSLGRVPAAARLGAILRSFYWSIAIPRTCTFNRQDLRYNYAGFDNHADGQALRESLKFCSPRLVHDTRTRNAFSSAVLAISRHYHALYYALLVGALGSAIWLSWRGLVVLTLPGWVFAANLGLIALLLNPSSRYIEVLDTLLVFQCLLAMGAFIARRRGSAEESTEPVDPR